MLSGKLNHWLLRTTRQSGTNIVPDLPVVLTTDTGLIRQENQDRVAAIRVNSKNNSFFAIALVDGMGGMRDGSKCAALALSNFLNTLIKCRQLPPLERLETATYEANQAVYQFSRGCGGATLSALLVNPYSKTAYIVNVGDSRIYASVAEGSKYLVSRLTVDDSLEEAVGGRGRELLQFIGMGDGIRPHVKEVPNNAERILVTSDGIHFINQEVLTDIFLNAKEPTDVAEELTMLAKWRGAPDNASLAITNIPQLIESLVTSEETGIEIWDPFSALHIMWMKQESGDVDGASDDYRNLRPSAAVQDESNAKKKTPKRKSKGEGRQKQKEKSNTPQLTIDIPGVSKGGNL